MNSLINLITTIGIGSIVLALIYIGRKLQILDSVEKDLSEFKAEVKESFKEMRVDFKELRQGFSDLKENVSDLHDGFGKLEEQVDISWMEDTAPSHSPRQLGEKGQRIFDQSGIGKIVDQLYEELKSQVKIKDVSNPYDAERSTAKVMEELPEHHPELLDQIKNGAFQSGTDVYTVLYVGSIYLRNKVFPELGFTL